MHTYSITFRWTNGTEIKGTNCVASQPLTPHTSLRRYQWLFCLKMSNAVYGRYTYFMIWVLLHNWDAAHCFAYFTGKCLHVFLFYSTLIRAHLWGLSRKVLSLLMLIMIISKRHLNAERTHREIQENNHIICRSNIELSNFTSLNPFLSGQMSSVY